MLSRLFFIANAHSNVPMPAARSVPRLMHPIIHQTVRTVATWSRQVDWRPPYLQQPVVDVSVLRTIGQRSPLHVIDSSALSRAGSIIAGGRSKGHKVFLRSSDSTLKYFYYKLPYYRGGFVKELVAATLAKNLLGDKAPAVYAVENVHTLDAAQAQYALASESLGTNVQYDNLERWAFLYEEDDEELQYGPRHLGLSLAFKLLLGDSDAKAANFVLLRNMQGECYSIDHEYAFDLAPQFVRSASLAIEQLKDFRTYENDRHIPLQAKPDLLAKIKPVFERAIQCDLDDGSVIAMYERFAALTDADFNLLFDQYGLLITADDRSNLLNDLRLRQAAVKEFIAESRKEQELINELRANINAARCSSMMRPG